MAAGLGSRFGGLKQLESFGPSGEFLMDYAIFDAIRLDFGKVIIIIRKEMEDDVNTLYNNVLREKIIFETAIQDNKVMLSGEIPYSRNKPWGTGHALLAVAEKVKGPFVLINADDFYGREALEIVSNFLKLQNDPKSCALVGYQLKNTLSEYGRVSRAICSISNDSQLDSIVEKLAIGFNDVGEITSKFDENETIISPSALVSLNCWGFQQSVFQYFETKFRQFLADNRNMTKEYFLPSVVQEMINENKVTVTVLPVMSKWIGVTFPQDSTNVKRHLQSLIKSQVYPTNLWK